MLVGLWQLYYWRRYLPVLRDDRHAEGDGGGDDEDGIKDGQHDQDFSNKYGWIYMVETIKYTVMIFCSDYWMSRILVLSYPINYWG